ncbi:MAG: hypothetical protein WDM90_02675 [Ferruginibacter sp.]
MIGSILQPSLNITTEKVNTINDPFRSLINIKMYKNFISVW